MAAQIEDVAPNEGKLELDLGVLGAALAVIDTSGRVLSATASARALLAPLVAGEHPMQLAEPHRTQLQRARHGAPIVLTAAGSDGFAIRVSVACCPLDPTRSLVMLRDHSPHERALARQMAKHRVESLGRIVASVAHDLRAPLSSISLNTSALVSTERQRMADDGQRALDDVQAATERMRASIDRLIDFAHVGPPVRERLSVRDTLGRVRQVLSTLLKQGGHGVAFTVHAGAEQVIGNRLVVEQILVELTLNALEASDGPAHIDVTATRRGSDVELHFADDGPGIPAELSHAIFEPFVTTKPMGIGHGLTQARAAAREQGGELVLLPSARGAHFVLLLPAALGPEGA